MDQNIKKVGGILFLISSLLLFTGCSEDNHEQIDEVAVSDDEKNIEAVRTVLESHFTVPNEEYIQIQKNINKKLDEIRDSLPEGSSYGIPDDSPEWLAYEDLVSKTYGPYFMDYAYVHLIPTNQAFTYHFGTEQEEVRYEMKVSEIVVTKSENEKTPKNYDFIVQVEYKNNDGEISYHEITGRAILSEVGKIGKLDIRDNVNLREKIKEDKGFF